MRLFLVRGLPGVGKTALAAKLAPSVVEADQFFMTDDGYVFDAARLPAAHGWCQDTVRRLLSEGRGDIAVANTFTRRWELEAYYDMARAVDADVVEVAVSSQVWSSADLESRTLHGVSACTIEAMRQRWEY